MLKFSFNGKGARCKIKGLASTDSFFRNANKDASSYFESVLKNRILDGPQTGGAYGSGFYVRAQAGKLLGSHKTVKANEYVSGVIQNLSEASYRPYVQAWSRRKYGKDFYKIAVDLYAEKAIEKLGDEFKRMMKRVKDCERYSYRNQLPTFGSRQ